MATYYRWQRSTIQYNTKTENDYYFIIGNLPSGSSTSVSIGQSYTTSGQLFVLNGTTSYIINSGTTYIQISNNSYCTYGGARRSEMFYGKEAPYVEYNHSNGDVILRAHDNDVVKFSRVPAPATSQGYVYSTVSSAYPTDGASGSYYYNQRTTVTSPTTASNLTYPESLNAITQSSIQLQWTGAQSNTSYPVTQYEVSYAINNTDSWQVAGTTGVLTYEFSNIPKEATSIAFRVRAKDSNGQYGDYVTGTYSTITRESPITVTTRTIEMNYFNGTDYEILYPVVGSEVYNNVKSGNYIGSGQFGQSNPSSLEFEFTPKMVMIAKTSGVYDTYLLKGKTVSYVQSSTGVSEITVEWTGNKVSWYSTESAGVQLNESGTLYYYVVFG